jgi:hypothetical protein
MKTRLTLLIAVMGAGSALISGCGATVNAPEPVAVTSKLPAKPHAKPHATAHAAKPSAPGAAASSAANTPGAVNPYSGAPSAAATPSVTPQADQGDPSGKPCTSLLGSPGTYTWSATESVWVCSDGT